MGGGGKNATSTSSVSIPPEVLARYNAVNTRAETAASTPYAAFGKTASDYVAQMNAQQGAGISDINATAGSYQPYMTQATSATQAGMGPASEGIDRYMSPYIKNVADTTGAMMRQQAEQAQSGALGSAISSGAFGGDRAGIAAANLQQQNQMGYGKTMADIMNQGYTQALGASQADLGRQLQGGAQMAGLGAQSQQLGLQGAQAKIAAGTMQQQTEQAGKDAMINQFMQEKGYPFQTAQFLANIAMGTGAATGSTTTTQTPRNWLGFASGGAVEGYASGGVAGPRTYTQSGVGGEGYVPAGDLPVGQLMVADVPEQSKSNGTDEIIKMITMAMGAARGGAVDQRHGYAGGGRPQPGSIFNPVTKRWEIPAAETALARAPVVETPPVEPTGVVAPVTRPAPPTTTSNGVIPRLRPDQQPNRGIPLLTQADYGMSEPEFKDYTSRTYSSPAEAAVGANRYYEKAGEGVGDAASIQHANRIYAAIQNGGEGLEPNELALYNHYKEKGWNDDTQIAGMIGRFNVEAGAGINPNARNTLGGGYGTYGVMQARGPRFEGLAEAGGLSTADLEAMPVTHGLSSGVAGGDNLNTNVSTMDNPKYANLGDPLRMDKPYEDRNIIGKFFHNRDGSLNSNAIMSLLGGLAKGAEAQTISPLGGILSGLGGGMETYKQLLKQTPEVTKANIENTDALQTAYLRAQQLNGYTGTIEEFAKSQGWANSPFGGTTGPAPTQGEMFGAPFDFAGQGMRTKIMLDGREVYAGQSLAWLQAYKNWLNSQHLTKLVDPTLVSSVDTAIEAAKAGNGQLSDTSGNVFTDPAVRAGTFGAGQLISSAERTQQLLAELPVATARTQMEDAKLSELSNAVVGMGDTGPLVEVLLPYRQLAYELNLVDPNDTTVSNQEILRKGLAGDALNQLQAVGGDVATQSYLQQQANATFSGALTKPAIAEILAIRSGINEYNKAFYAYAKELKRTDPNADLYQAELNFKASKPLAQFIEEQRPVYEEAILNPPAPPVRPYADPVLWADKQYREDFEAGASP